MKKKIEIDEIQKGFLDQACAMKEHIINFEDSDEEFEVINWVSKQVMIDKISELHNKILANPLWINPINPMNDLEYIYRQNLTDLSVWFPVLEKLGIPVPETYIIKHKVDLFPLLDWESPEGIDKLVEDIDYYANKVWYPCFLRTGQTSNKHNWKNTCFLTKKEDIISHLANLQDFSVMADMFSPRSMETLVVRKMLDTTAIFTAFEEMPITKEMRLFVKDWKIESLHPYWPQEAFEKFNIEGIEEKMNELISLTEEEKLFFSKIWTFLAQAFPWYWSIDFLKTTNWEWICIDMAQGHNSYKNKEQQIIL